MNFVLKQFILRFIMINTGLVLTGWDVFWLPLFGQAERICTGIEITRVCNFKIIEIHIATAGSQLDKTER